MTPLYHTLQQLPLFAYEAYFDIPEIIVATLHDAQQLSLFPTKVCSRCGAEKFLIQFSKAPRCTDGHRTYCTTCQNIYSNKNRRENYTRNPEHYRQRSQRWDANHPKQVRHRKQRYYARNAEHFHATNKKWRQANSLKDRERSRRRRVRKQEVTVDKVNYERILERDGWYCYICNQSIDPTIKKGSASLTFDHEKPLAGEGDRKGAHSEDNIHPAHRVCNCRKGVRLLEEMTPFQRRGIVE